MSETVIWEMQFIGVTITLGVFLSIIYDVVRIFRRVVRHKTIGIAVEDIIFWAISGIVIFVVSFWENDGGVRWYTVAGVIFGAYLYHETFSVFFVEYISKIINLPFNVIKKALKNMRQSFRINLQKEGETVNGKAQKEKDT